jgi:hypothetical protein
MDMAPLVLRPGEEQNITVDFLPHKKSEPHGQSSTKFHSIQAQIRFWRLTPLHFPKNFKKKLKKEEICGYVGLPPL